MTTNRRRCSVDLARFTVVACTVLSRFFSGAGGGVRVDAFSIAVTTTRRSGKLFSAASQQFAPASTSASPLAEHGDWQAFFDEERYCLVYYFNTVTGTSQWEPPDNFPIPAVRHHQQNNNKPASSITITGIQQHTHQDDRRVQAARKTESKEKEGQSAFQWIVKGAFQAASDLLEKQQQQEAEKKKKPVKDSKPWWSFLVDGDDDTETVQRAAPKGTYEVVRHQPVTSRPQSQPKQQKKEPSFWDRLFSSPKTESHRNNRSAHANGQPQDHVPSRRTQPSIGTTLQQQHTEWLKFMNDEDGDSSPTFPLVPPSEREAKLQQKLYADSLARQENLRRNYKAVQEHRSRTFSLSALKRDNPQAKEWHQFLSD